MQIHSSVRSEEKAHTVNTPGLKDILVNFWKSSQLWILRHVSSPAGASGKLSSFAVVIEVLGHFLSSLVCFFDLNM